MKSQKFGNLGKIYCISKLFRMLLSTMISLSLITALLTSGEVAVHNVAAAGTAVIDPNLSAAVLTGPGPFEVIVTFRGDSAPGAAEITALNQAGISCKA